MIDWESFTPGSALTGAGEPKAVVFMVAMLAGMGAFKLIESHRRRTSRGTPAADS